ncbi:P44/Msp2 family outer membrane protein [Wolbachia endosymbiont of Folsomia candida]|uniref:P44/Msp2 family outer membrane protein n=1 Tax=Wolbachia endosymbiont of Folsomia candida TaxID=169402 RepID=UPI000AF7D91D|nr:P44/Msp2 family outer membrane protein [Wolbachia endosymbiont of Folsomia candida]APR97777.1 P44/Msp2 family outer membrane protein [Wolbachia endosymbiont of Folsomia candida]
MINKKTLAVTAFALLLSQQSFANETKGFYFGGGYHGQFFNNTSELKVKIAGKDAAANNKLHINDRAASQTDGVLISQYKGDYNPPFAANVAIGYAGEFKNHSYRAELEGIYSSVKVDNIGLASSQMTIGYIKGDATNNTKHGVVVNHDHIENASVMANVYHHWKNDRFSFSPYVGAGVGVTRMEMFEQSSIKPAYQLKAGLDYRMTEDTNIHIGYRHFGAVGADFKLTANKLGETKSSTFAPYSGTAVTEEINIGNKLFSTHGVEVGLTVHFSSGA